MPGTKAAPSTVNTLQPDSSATQPLGGERDRRSEASLRKALSNPDAKNGKDAKDGKDSAKDKAPAPAPEPKAAPAEDGAVTPAAGPDRTM